MKKSLLLLISMLLLGCDLQPPNQPRTMIIGGMPVHEQDYKRPQSQPTTSSQAFN